MVATRQLRELWVADPARPGGHRPLSAASGAERVGDRLYVVADDEHDLAAFELTAAGHARPGVLLDAGRPALPADAGERKKVKPDHEALVGLPGLGLLALGSGSTQARRSGLLWPLDAGGRVAAPPREIDLGPLHAELDARLPDLNLEGAAVVGEHLVLLQRGSGKQGVDSLVFLDLGVALSDLAGGALSARGLERIDEHDLGEVDGVRLSFTDGAGLPDGRLVVTAVAEAGESTYLDGECVGAVVGILDPATGRLRLERLDPLHKVEGVVATAAGGRIEVLLTADADDPSVPSPLLAGSL